MSAAAGEIETTIGGSAAQHLLRAIDSLDEKLMLLAAQLRCLQPVTVGLLEDAERECLIILDVISPAARLAIARAAHEGKL